MIDFDNAWTVGKNKTVRMIQLKIFDPIKIEKKKNKLNEGKKKGSWGLENINKNLVLFNISNKVPCQN